LAQHLVNSASSGLQRRHALIAMRSERLGRRRRDRAAMDRFVDFGRFDVVEERLTVMRLRHTRKACAAVGDVAP